MSGDLRLERVTAGYGRSVVLHEVDLVVPERRAVALLGANGAGKTTLLKVAAGLLRPMVGEIWLGDRPIGRLPEYARARAGLCLIPEGHGIFRHLTVAENLAMFQSGGHRRSPGLAGQRGGDGVDRAVATFPLLGERLRQIAGTLSGGQQQMLALCRALVTDARMILADELSLGLAPVVVDEIFAAVDLLRAEGRSLLIVEQYVSRALTIADYVYILHKGRVAFVGEPEQCAEQQIFEQYVGSVA
ncbi:MAG: ABC transporter ATP-binding protein [Actinomycetota bacterium]